jgi:hypothetical protein
MKARDGDCLDQTSLAYPAEQHRDAHRDGRLGVWLTFGIEDLKRTSRASA